MPVNRGDEIVLRVEDAAFEGKSVARVDGLVVFIEGAVPGDEVMARITKAKARYAEARTTGVIVPSPLRVDPPCAHFGVCGGCSWQHLHYDAQLRFKQEHVRDALERIGGVTGIDVKPTLGSPDRYYYRNKMEYSFGDPWVPVPGGSPPALPGGTLPALGLHIPRRFDKVLEIGACWLQSETSNRILVEVRRAAMEACLSAYSTKTHRGYLRNLVVREGKRTGDVMVNLVTSEENPGFLTSLTARLVDAVPAVTTVVNNITQRESQVAVGDTERVFHGPGYITERIGKRTYRISANSFFQTNTAQAELLYDLVGRMGGLAKDQTVFDLYSGAGTISLHIADEVARVIAVESVESAVSDARTNAGLNGVSNCEFHAADLSAMKSGKEGWLWSLPAPSRVIVDPPRAGMHEKVVRALAALAPPRIVYVSCNPATLARDVQMLCAAGDYSVEEVQPVDMFPHTYHIETVVSLAKRPVMSPVA